MSSLEKKTFEAEWGDHEKICRFDRTPGPGVEYHFRRLNDSDFLPTGDYYIEEVIMSWRLGHMEDDWIPGKWEEWITLVGCPDFSIMWPTDKYCLSYTDKTEEQLAAAGRTVKSIMRKWLNENGFDGLFNDECACLRKDLMPCDCPGTNCQPGYKIPCDCDCHEFHITRKKPK